MAEYDRMGRDAFLETYGYGPARGYFLVHEGRRYDSKAIAGVAHRGVTGRPLLPEEFSGGRETVARQLIRLGFEVSAPGLELGEHTIETLLLKIDSLRTDRSKLTDQPRRHQPLTLLWALGRAAQTEPRLETWARTSAEISSLIEKFGHPADRPNPEFPVLRLFHDGLWELDESDVPPASTSSAQRWMRDHAPTGGLQPWVHTIVTKQADVRAQIVLLLLAKYFQGVDHDALLTAVGLSTVSDAEVHLNEGTPIPQRRPSTTMRVIRDSALAQQIKDLHGHHCQICGLQLRLPSGSYAEGAHIRPVGTPHDGPDEPGNILCLCPNDHVLFDRGGLTLTDDLLVYDEVAGQIRGSVRLAPQHAIKIAHVAYHRQVARQAAWRTPDVPRTDGP
ncbi:HNH endonuclease [Nonomuraea turcica]|uniref:HNH endonuclease n=1 Tax=Nonomuraea sp. G32 TaxID=3067274 RepID=UPI00273BCAAF|nr:HNH endonuclease [Nonomuraea sp. G32]MDP4512029.1 HNH endonuclease [Nonomuraea sp. G32]